MQYRSLIIIIVLYLLFWWTKKKILTRTAVCKVGGRIACYFFVHNFFFPSVNTGARRVGNPSHKMPRYRRSSTYSRAPPPPTPPLAHSSPHRKLAAATIYEMRALVYP